MKDRFVVIFDTEYTTWDDARETNWVLPDQHRELVQIAARKWVRGTDWRVSKTFTSFCRPRLNPQLSECFTKLTGINQSDIADAGCAKYALNLFNEEMELSSVFCTGAWSNGNDINPIAETAGLQRFLLPFQTEIFNNLRTIIHSYLRNEVGEYDSKEYPSGKLYQLLGLSLSTNQVHNAMHDVDSLCITISELMRRGHNFDVLWQ